MKKITLILFAILFTISCFAQTIDNKWALGAGLGGYWTHRSEDPWTSSKNHWKSLAFTPEVYLSRFLTPSFDAMLKGSLGFRKNDKSGSTDWGNLALNLRYKLANDKLISSTAKFQPYLFAGPTFLSDNNKKVLDFNAGLGFKIPFGLKDAFYMEGKYIDGVKAGNSSYYDPFNITNIKDYHIKLAVGIEFGLGKPKDTDGDGVPDKKDKCPGTPAGVKVDVNGCPLDRDGDGIPDYKDDCPDTPGLAKFNGCPDRDGDGIPDIKDECPDVPGLAKFNGCPDTDGDGVPDIRDECPNTPKGCAVDSKGCPIDTDKDGIIDCEDQCPTQPGLKENHGCPITCIKLNVDPVYFDFDKSDLRPAGIALLDDFVAKLAANNCKDYEIDVNGHTCSIGTKKYNQGLSERRAQSVVKYLVSKGINNAFITAKGFGETQPAVPNTTKANREKNRRAEINMILK